MSSDIVPGEESLDSDRPTVVPNFDIGEFARHNGELPETDGAPEKSGIVSISGPTHMDLEQSLLDQLGPLSRIPVIRVSPAELRSLPLDPHAGFLLANMDGISSIEMLLDLGGMPRVEALRLLANLVKEHIVELV